MVIGTLKNCSECREIKCCCPRTFGELIVNANHKQGELLEFPKGKENYCPRCYFDNDKVILRSKCVNHQ